MEALVRLPGPLVLQPSHPGPAPVPRPDPCQPGIPAAKHVPPQVSWHRPRFPDPLAWPRWEVARWYNQALFSSNLSLLRHRHLGPVTYSNALHVGITVAIFALSVLLGLVIRDLGVVFTYLGGTVGVVVPFTLPGLMLLSPRQGEVEVESAMLKSPTARKMIGYGLLLASLFIFVLTILSSAIGL